eukprot:TRINITY_DN1598_c0_g4_i1.p1 TRINITY_DN1598_c0_g4~~TRINITY_DN1598_c0_g4_i1.p1  ORF type:complete len:363 (+),score=-6.81 TRINITY_DN1598_c0_g4_i1:892-1980(+)
MSDVGNMDPNFHNKASLATTKPMIQVFCLFFFLGKVHCRLFVVQKVSQYNVLNIEYFVIQCRTFYNAPMSTIVRQDFNVEYFVRKIFYLVIVNYMCRISQKYSPHIFHFSQLFFTHHSCIFLRNVRFLFLLFEHFYRQRLSFQCMFAFIFFFFLQLFFFLCKQLQSKVIVSKCVVYIIAMMNVWAIGRQVQFCVVLFMKFIQIFSPFSKIEVVFNTIIWYVVCMYGDVFVCADVCSSLIRKQIRNYYYYYHFFQQNIFSRLCVRAACGEVGSQILPLLLMLVWFVFVVDVASSIKILFIFQLKVAKKGFSDIIINIPLGNIVKEKVIFFVYTSNAIDTRIFPYFNNQYNCEQCVYLGEVFVT